MKAVDCWRSPGGRDGSVSVTVAVVLAESSQHTAPRRQSMARIRTEEDEEEDEDEDEVVDQARGVASPVMSVVGKQAVEPALVVERVAPVHRFFHCKKRVHLVVVECVSLVLVMESGAPALGRVH